MDNQNPTPGQPESAQKPRNNELSVPESTPVQQPVCPDSSVVTDSATDKSPGISRWHWHRRLYNWVLHWANTPYGGPALFILAFAESSFFPVPPDVLLAPLTLGNRNKWHKFALSCSLASVVGGILGYIIGHWLWFTGEQYSGLAEFCFAHIPGFGQVEFEKAQQWYERWSFWVVFAAGFTPLPYKVITISAGACNINFFIFVIASAVSRSARFFLVAGLFWKFGPTIKPFIDKYFNWLCLLFMVLLVGGFIVLKYL
ncbi:MAG: DedA family protein [Sedimentisphaerales bacterium]|nr:DedA family protein [Sedimentisphaerales bacterium]